MKSRRAWAVERETAEQDHPRLSTGAGDDAGARQVGRETLAQETRQQPSDQPVFQMKLQHALGIELCRGDLFNRRPHRHAPRERHFFWRQRGLADDLRHGAGHERADRNHFLRIAVECAA